MTHLSINRTSSAGVARYAYLLRAAVIALIGFSPAGAVAAPEEIQVYTDDINEPGEFGLEMHVN